MSILDSHIFDETLANSMNAPHWKLFFARMFGIKRIHYESGYKLTLYYFRGKYYLAKMEKEK